MLQDYNNALNIYRSAVKDYLNDKSYLHYAAASEMAGLCTFLLEPTKRDLETYFDNACTSYMKENFNRFALRVTFFFTEILKVRRNPSEAAARLIRIADKDLDKLTSAMLHEQAAFAYLYNVPIQYRKFSFRLILAGHYFNLINQVFFFLFYFFLGLNVLFLFFFKFSINMLLDVILLLIQFTNLKIGII